MESKFQFIKPILKSVEYVVNENFEKDTTKSIDMNMNMTVSVKKSVVSSTEASVSLTVNLGEKNNDDFPFYLNKSCSSKASAALAVLSFFFFSSIFGFFLYTKSTIL